MYRNLFRITVLIAAIAMILSACAAPATVQPIATLAPATEVVPTATEVAPTHTPEPTTTQVVLGVIEGRIAFQSDRDGNNEIYIMNGDGSGLTNLTNNPAGDGAPVWSPDGTQLVFESNRDGNLELYVMNADGSHPTRLTNMPEGIGGQRWSLDGTQIIFDTAGDIYVMNADGSGQMRLTDNPASDGSPMFKP